MEEGRYPANRSVQASSVLLREPTGARAHLSPRPGHHSGSLQGENRGPERPGSAQSRGRAQTSTHEDFPARFL